MVMGRIRTLAGDEDLGLGRGRRHESRFWGTGEMNDSGVCVWGGGVGDI